MSKLAAVYPDFKDRFVSGRARIENLLNAFDDDDLSQFFVLHFLTEEREQGCSILISHSEWNEEPHSQISITLPDHAISSTDTTPLIENIGSFILQHLKSVAGFSFGQCPEVLTASYPSGYCGMISGYKSVDEQTYNKFDDELFWFKRLARPIELMIKHGLFRNVYPYNFVCEQQLFTLKLLFDHDDFPKLSRKLGNKLRKRREFLTMPRPALPGTIVGLGSHGALWTVPTEQRADAFAVLSAANLTLYRFFIDHNDLFPEKQESH